MMSNDLNITIFILISVLYETCLATGEVSYLSICFSLVDFGPYSLFQFLAATCHFNDQKLAICAMVILVYMDRCTYGVQCTSPPKKCAGPTTVDIHGNLWHDSCGTKSPPGSMPSTSSCSPFASVGVVSWTWMLERSSSGTLPVDRLISVVNHVWFSRALDELVPMGRWQPLKTTIRILYTIHV